MDDSGSRRQLLIAVAMLLAGIGQVFGVADGDLGVWGVAAASAFFLVGAVSLWQFYHSRQPSAAESA